MIKEQFQFLRLTFGSNFLSLLSTLLFQLIAFWAVWRWLALRVWTSAEERWSFPALAAAIFFAFFWTKIETIGEPEVSKSQFSAFNYSGSIFFTAIYAASFAVAAPPLARAVTAMTALTFTLSRWRFSATFHLGLFGLLLLSLPSVASLQFYLGYPLRVLVGKATARLLQMQGLDVWREGVCLHFGEKLIWIDAPCSGVKMLWFGLFLAAFLVCFFRLSNLKSLAVFASAFLIITLGNVFRASALFYIEAEIFDAPEFMHEAVGVFSFAFVALGIVFVAQFWRTVQNIAVVPTAVLRAYSAQRWCASLPAAASETLTGQPSGRRRYVNLRVSKYLLNTNLVARKFVTIIFLATCSFAFVAPFWFSSEKKAPVQTSNFRGFPATFENQPLAELPLTEREKFFLEDFPGKVGRFSDGKREIVIRFVTEATRKLHPASDCFRAIGYETKPLPLKVDDAGKRWSCFSAVKTGEELSVCERIYDNRGGEWTDVSAWYWSALNETGGEWWAITVAERK